MSTSHGELEGQEVEAELQYDNVNATPEPLRSSTSSLTPITRTVAIIKTHALPHRFDIERRIQEASFEVRFLFSFDALGTCIAYTFVNFISDCQRKANGI